MGVGEPENHMQTTDKQPVPMSTFAAVTIALVAMPLALVARALVLASHVATFPAWVLMHAAVALSRAAANVAVRVARRK